MGMAGAALHLKAIAHQSKAHAAISAARRLLLSPLPHPISCSLQEDTILALFDMMYEKHHVFLNQKWMGAAHLGRGGRLRSTSCCCGVCQNVQLHRSSPMLPLCVTFVPVRQARSQLSLTLFPALMPLTAHASAPSAVAPAGFTMMQDPFDLVSIQMLLFDVRPGEADGALPAAVPTHACRGLAK